MSTLYCFLSFSFINSVLFLSEQNNADCFVQTFLVFFAQQDQLMPDTSKIQAVAEWPSLTTRKQLQKFLGFANFCKCFIWNYSKVLEPMARLPSTIHPFSWTEEEEVAYSHSPGHLSFIIQILLGRLQKKQTLQTQGWALSYPIELSKTCSGGR